MEEFYQRKLFLKKKFIFKSNGIDMELKDSDGDFSLFVPFDKISSRNDIRTFTKKKKTILRLGLALTALTLFKGILSIGTDTRAFLAATATAAIVAIMFCGYYYFTYLKYYAVPLTSGKFFHVLCSSPSLAAVDDFMDEMYERRQNYLRSEYFFIDYENDKKKELGKMQWLFDEGVITDAELEVVTDEINENIGD